MLQLSRQKCCVNAKIITPLSPLQHPAHRREEPRRAQGGRQDPRERQHPPARARRGRADGRGPVRGQVRGRQARQGGDRGGDALQVSGLRKRCALVDFVVHKQLNFLGI